ncbi:MAG: hypothetical protein ACREID_00740, partial [Planctomycetota bacterium]
MKALHPVLGAVLAAALSAPAAAADAFEAWLPEDTLFFASLDDWAETCRRYKGGPLDLFWNDPAMQAFLERPLDRWKQWNDEARAKAGVSWDEGIALLQGQLSVAIPRLVAERGGEPDIVILCDLGENAAKVPELLKRVEETAGKDLRRTEEEFRGVTLVTFLKEGAGEPEPDTAYFLDGATFAIANRPEPLRDVVARRGDPEAPSLGRSETFRKMRQRAGARVDAFAYADVQALIAALAGEIGMGGEKAATIIQGLGLGTVRAMSLGLELQPEGIAQSVHVLAPGKKSGALKLVDGKNAALAPPRFVPPDAVSWGAWTCDFQGLWAEARAAAENIQPGAGAQMDMYLE